MGKDPLCPLGFHPQVRWPTRCKRCFREYKEHAAKKDEPTERVSFLKKLETEAQQESQASSTTSSSDKKDYSSPYSSISTAAQNRLSKIRPDDPTKKAVFAGTDAFLSPPDAGPLRRNTTDLSTFLESEKSSDGKSQFLSPADSNVTIRLKKSNSFNEAEGGDRSIESPSPPPRSKTPVPAPTFQVSESTSSELTNGRRKSSTTSATGGSSDTSSDEGATTKVKKTKKKRLLIQGVQEVFSSPPQDDVYGSFDNGSETPDSSADVAFIIQVKSTRKKKKEDDDDETMSMTTATDTTDTTLVDVNETGAGGLSLWEFDEMKKELDRLKEKCDKLEKEKADILSRRVLTLEAPKAQSNEYLKLQQKVNQLTTTNEDLKDEQKHLETRVRELESELSNRPTGDFLTRSISELRSKLANAEAEIEKLHEEKRETVTQMNDMQEEFEEMQDGFREEQSEEFANLKRDLDDANKSLRLLQFKLRKTEKRADAAEAEKKELEVRLDSMKNVNKITELEDEVTKLKGENEKLLRESFKGRKDLSPRPALKKKSPVLTKAPSGETVDPPVPSDVDPAQLLRDLQSTLERESDLREQLKFAEEEVNSLRQKISRIEEENESLLIQIKKISTKSKPESLKGKDAGKGPAFPGTSEKLDANELKLQLELNEQESKILRRKVEELENSNNKLSKDLQNTAEKLEAVEKENSCFITKSKNVEEVSILRRKVIEKERELERVQAELQGLKSKGKVTRAKSVEVEESAKRLEIETKNELKRVQDELAKTKLESSNQVKNLEQELSRAQRDVENHQSRITQINESNKTLLAHIEKFKRDIATMKTHYEAIQDDVVSRNAKVHAEKENLEKTLTLLRREYDTVERELKALRETFNQRQDTWIKEKLSMQESQRSLEQTISKNTIRNSNPGREGQNPQLKNIVKDQTFELDTQRKEMENYKDQIVFMQKENDELRKQLEDFEKLSQVQIRSISNEPTAKSDKEIKLIRERLLMEEKAHRNEMAQMKLRHEQQVAMKTEEISSIQSQLSRAKRERDTFRQMVDSAQRAIAELKSRDSSTRRESISGLEEAATGARAAVIGLQERVAALEDELSDSRRDTARAKTEVATERSTWELKLGEMQQKINELEEDKLLSSGRARAAGQRSRLELAWQKERDEQQRRLKEATTLARDLKTTLQEIERERDREKIEGRRRLEQLKSALEDEQVELRNKVSESQCDLLELRDAHAKLRTANEKLRRDREKLEKEKETQLRKEIEGRSIVLERERILDDLINRLSPMSMSTQPQQLGAKLNLREILQVLQNMKKLVESTDPAIPKEIKRSGFRRTASAETESNPPENLTVSSSAYGKEHYGLSGSVSRAAVKYSGSSSSSTLTLPASSRTSREVSHDPATAGSRIRGKSVDKARVQAAPPSNAQSSLFRKSLSLEQNVSMPDEQVIWKGESEAGSGSSLNSRGSSVDRFSTISSKSEKPKSKGLVGKMKKLVKSRSIEESTTADRVVKAGVQAAATGVGSNSGSITSLTSETGSTGNGRDKEGHGGRTKLKDKVIGMFRRSSRSPSVERSRIPVQPPEPPTRPSRESTPKRESTQRPLMPAMESTQRPLKPAPR